MLFCSPVPLILPELVSLRLLEVMMLVVPVMVPELSMMAWLFA